MTDDGDKGDSSASESNDRVGNAQGGGDASGSGNILAGVQEETDGAEGKDGGKGEERRED